MEAPSLAEIPAINSFHQYEASLLEPELSSHAGSSFADAEARQSATLLATLSILACRKEPEMVAVSKVLCSQLEWSDQRAAVIGAEILAASGLFSPSAPNSQLLMPVLSGTTTTLPIDRTIFDDRETQLALWKAADPDFALLQAHAEPTKTASSVSTCTQPACGPASDAAWGPQMVSNLLARLGIYYTLNDSCMDLDSTRVMDSLAWGYRWVPEAAEHIYEILFPRETWMAIFNAVDKDGNLDSEEEVEEGDWKEDLLDDFYNLHHINIKSFDAEMKQSLKLLLMSLTVFLSAGLILGHTLT